MAALGVRTAGSIEVVEPIEQLTLPAGEVLAAGDLVGIDGNGRWIRTTPADDGGVGYGIVVRNARYNEAVTAFRRAVLDGFVLDALPFAAPLYAGDTAGKIVDVVETMAVPIATVIPATGVGRNESFDRLLLLDVPIGTVSP
jgi:hypothetical protein